MERVEKMGDDEIEEIEYIYIGTADFHYFIANGEIIASSHYINIVNENRYEMRPLTIQKRYESYKEFIEYIIKEKLIPEKQLKQIELREPVTCNIRTKECDELAGILVKIKEVMNK